MISPKGRKLSFIDILKADLRANLKPQSLVGFLNGFVFSPGFRVVFFYRCSVNLEKAGRISHVLGKMIWRLNVAQSGCYLSPLSVIKEGLFLPHPTGVVVGEGVVIGSDVTIYQHVTLGRSHRDTPSYPKVGNGAVIYAGAVIVGDIRIGDEAVIGANAVVRTNVPEHARAVGNPARILS
ncbi:serine O-acetyltransferase [Caulobacter sp. DWR2-3-1b2]|uniref:serine O-acetyltransferase n=1 Tax=unclassified Caulobacter TaxID=2648921 RepID=UPI003CF6EB70